MLAASAAALRPKTAEHERGDAQRIHRGQREYQQRAAWQWEIGCVLVSAQGGEVDTLDKVVAHFTHCLLVAKQGLWRKVLHRVAHVVVVLKTLHHRKIQPRDVLFPEGRKVRVVLQHLVNQGGE
ncbi:hypothetical protein D3C86_1905170 [compost metagenome]